MKLDEIGNLMCLYIKEISSPATDAPEALIKSVAKALIQLGGRNWIPVIVKETDEDQYEVIGNAFIYAVAKEAGLEKIWCIIADDSQEAADLTKILSGEINAIDWATSQNSEPIQETLESTNSTEIATETTATTTAPTTTEQVEIEAQLMTVAQLKQEYGTLHCAKASLGIKARSWSDLSDKLFWQQNSTPKAPRRQTAHTVEELKAHYGKLWKAKDALKVKANSWQQLVEKLNAA